MNPLTSRNVITARAMLADCLEPHIVANLVCKTAQSILAGNKEDFERVVTAGLVEADPETPAVDHRAIVKALLIVAQAQVDA